MPLNKLTAVEVKNKAKPGRYGDGGGLWLQVRASSNDEAPPNKSWLFRYAFAGRQQQMGLGPVDTVTLAEAREKATGARKLLLDGVNPLNAKKARAAEAAAAGANMTFRAVAELYIAAHEPTWRNKRHGALWRQTLEDYAYKKFGDWLVRDVDTGAVTRAIEPIWHDKPETAGRVRARVESILNYATTRGWRTGDNPARWRGHLANLLPARSRVAKVQHHSALPWKQIGPFVAALRAEGGTAAKALQFTILTAARTTETTGARWREIDLAQSLWTVPADRMKAGREHRVPLSTEAVKLLREIKPTEIAPGSLVFPGGRPKAPLSNMAMASVLRRMKRTDITVHGFRSTFRDWVGESTAYPRELAEAALAHVLKDKTEAAYSRGDALEKRSRLMQEWATFCGRSEPISGAVASIARHA